MLNNNSSWGLLYTRIAFALRKELPTRKWFNNLSLQNKIQLQIQPVLAILLSAATFFIYQQMRSNIIFDQAQRAEGVAMQVIDSANMLMVTGAISNNYNKFIFEAP